MSCDRDRVSFAFPVLWSMVKNISMLAAAGTEPFNLREARSGPFEWIVTGNFILVGDTSSHPYNHYGKSPFLDSLKQLALDYGGRWNRNLAYNDSSLEWGGIFDISGNWSPPHSTHREGTNQDVRANGGLSSIPFDAAIRQWFVERVTQLFGQAPLHESAGTSNEHYHIRGGDLP